MPVVRIVGSVPEGIYDLPQQLRDRGFDVETVSDTANCEPGTLEITLEECSTEEALSRALALAEGNDIAILVSPGTVVPAAPVFDSTEEQIPSLAAGVPVSALDNMPPASAEPIESPAHAPEPEPVYLACETHFEPPLKLATTPTAPAEPSHQEEESVAADETEIFAQQQHSGPPVGDTGPASWPVLERQDEPAALPDADWVEPEPVAALPANAADDSDWPIWQVADEDEQAPRSAVEVPESASPILTEHVAALHNLGRRFCAAAQLNRILSDDQLFTRIAISSVAVAILLLVGGLTTHRFSPLPSRVLHGSREAAQPAPFKRSAAAASPITASEVVPADAAEPAAPRVTPASAQVLVRYSSKLTSRRSPKKASGDAGFVAKDTVVRFNQPPREPLPQTAKKQSGVKYYTDLKQ
jgi:hypothetical protein